MKHIIIFISLCIAPLLFQVQLHATEYKVVCKRVTGCPVVNGTCPTCEIVGKKSKRFTKAEFEEWGRQLKETLRYQWDHDYYKNDSTEREPSGWDWNGPTWNGLRVLN
tara:strand:- start:19 stop:342 length:324 start_codon:yes stop_codon:yes gene_type:complete